MIYLTCNGIWADFIEYAIAGVSTFSNSVAYTDMFSNKLYKTLGYGIPISLGIFVIVYLFTLVRKGLRDKAWTRELEIFLVYDIASISIIYPICDVTHFSIGSVCTLITVVYFIYKLFKYVMRERKKLQFAIETFFETAAILLLLIYVAMSIKTLVEYVQEAENVDYLNHFSYIATTENLYERVQLVDEYIIDQEAEGKNVYILDPMAVVFMIPIDEYHKNYDMFNLGNLGSRGEDGIIEDLEQEKNVTVFVMSDNYSKNWQLPTNVVEYVKENFEYIDTIDVFDVYTKGTE